jgi:hypothetical protein
MRLAGRCPNRTKKTDDIKQSCKPKMVKLFNPSATTQISTFFNQIESVFDQAVQVVGGATDRFYRLGSQTIRLSFAGDRLIPSFTQALAHLETDATDTPDLTFCLWDGESTGTTLPPPPWSQDAYGQHGEITGFNTERFRVAYEIVGGVLQLLDIERGRGYVFARAAEGIPQWMLGAPLRSLLHWGFENQSYQLCHGGAVGLPDGGVLLTGASGSGKSTSTLACLGSALGYAGDDYVLLDTAAPPHVYSLYRTAKLNFDNVHRFPHFRAGLGDGDPLDGDKALMWVDSARMLNHFPLRALLIPKVTGLRDTHIVPATPITALKALAPTTAMHIYSGRQKTITKLSELVRRVPAYTLEAGTDLAQIPAAIHRLLLEELNV